MKSHLRVALGASILALTLALSACTGANQPQPPATPSVTPTPLLTFKDLGGVEAQLALDGSFAASLTRGNLALRATSGAKYTRSRATLPIVGGTLRYYNPKVQAFLPDGVVQGTVRCGGTLTFTAGSQRLTVRDMVVDTRVHGTITGSVGGGQRVRLFDLDGSGVKPLSQNTAGAAVVSGYRVKLAREFAEVLNQRFPKSRFATGAPAASLTLNLELPKAK